MDYGSYANFESRKLLDKLSLRFNPGTEDISEHLQGYKGLSSTDKKSAP